MLLYLTKASAPAAAAPIRQDASVLRAVIPAGGRHVFHQAPGGGHDLPSNCFGTARVTTGGEDERVIAMVYDATAADGGGDDVLLSAFTALPDGAATERVALPLFRRNHVGLTTGIQVMNVGSDPVDVLYIDGDHTLEGVSADYEAYRGLVRPGGMIILHDVVDRGPDDLIQVAPLWKRLRAEYGQAEEIIEDAAGVNGIGILRTPG